MKSKFNSLIIALLLFVTFLNFGCKNFLNSSDFLEELNKSVEYTNSNFVSVKITADNDACNSIIPAVNLYTKDYKNRDVINLEFEEKSDYLFLYWNVTPKDAVVFADEKARVTTAEINYKGNDTIIIEPVCTKKIVLNIYPDNTVINPKNTPIVISYSQKMDIKKEDLSKIKITLDSSGADLKSFYQEPTITFDDEGTKISYVPKRDALLNIKTTEKITVNVPEFNFVYNEKITIPYGSDTTYIFEINNETLDKVQIEFTSYDNEGKIQFKNTSNYSLDEKIINTFEPNDDYNIVDWQVLYDDNKTAVDPNVISYSIK